MINMKNLKMKEKIELIGYKKTTCGKTIPMYSDDPDWIELRDKLRKKVDEIEDQLTEGGEA